MPLSPIFATKKFWLASLLAVIFIGSSLLLARPTLSLIKQWRAEHLFAAAKEEQSKKNLLSAFEKAFTAYRLYPQNIEIHRYALQLLSLISPAEALPLWIDLAKETESPDDESNTIHLALQLGDVITAEKFLERLKEKEDDSLRALLFEAKLLAIKQDFNGAALIAAKIADRPDAPVDSHEFYVKLSQLSSSAVERTASLEHLREIAKEPNQVGLQALRTLSSYPGNTPEDIKTIIEGLNNNPKADKKDAVLAISLSQKIGEATTNQVLSRAEELFAQSSPEQMVELGRFLNEQGAYEKTAHCIPMEAAMKRYDLFLIWADAMAVTKQWNTLNKALSDEKVPVDNFLKHLFLARVAEGENKANTALYEWDRAFFEAGKNPELLWFLVTYSLRLKHYDKAEKGLNILKTIPSQAQQAWVNMAILYQDNRQTKDLLKCLEEMNQIYPHNLEILNDLIYTRALLGTLSPADSARIKHLVSQNPKILAYRVTLALSFLREQNIKDAAAVLDNLDINWSEVNPHWRTVYAAVLNAQGKYALAGLVLNGINNQSVLPEEWILAQSK